MLFFVMSVTACNKEEFYQKDYLENPFSDNTEVSAGVDSGVTSGSTDGTTGGTSGSVSGGTTSGGSVTGSTSGGSTTGDSTSGGTSSGGATTGSTSGGATTGSTSGGATTGSTSGGATTGSTAGGATTGSTSGGSTTGSTSGGSTTGGSTTGGVTQQNVTESFRQAASETKKLDIMWVIDNSGSMADEQASLGANFDSFITQFINKNVDFKMGITTTDTSSSSKKGAMVVGSDTKLTSAAAAANPNKFMSDFNRLVNVGIGGSGNEKGLEAAQGFMDKHAVGTNPFIRPEAYLAIVILSDEEDQSPRSVAAYTDYLKTFKVNAGLVKVYSIVNVNNVYTGGNTIGHLRYKQATEQTSGVVADIMDDYANVLLAMGDSIINLLDSFALASTPVNGTLKVFVNGVETSGYTFDSASRSIKFDAGNLPPVGAQVRVEYKKVL